MNNIEEFKNKYLELQVIEFKDWKINEYIIVSGHLEWDSDLEYYVYDFEVDLHPKINGFLKLFGMTWKDFYEEIQDLIYDSKQFKKHNKILHKFNKESEKFGKKEFGDSEYLWDNVFNV